MNEIKKEDVKVEAEAKPEIPEKKPIEKKQNKKAVPFKDRKLAVINNMANPAKAKRLAERVLAEPRKAVK